MSKTASESLKETIKILKKEYGISSASLSELIGEEKGYLYNMTRPNSNVPRSVIERLFAASPHFAKTFTSVQSEGKSQSAILTKEDKAALAALAEMQAHLLRVEVENNGFRAENKELRESEKKLLKELAEVRREFLEYFIKK